MRIRFNLRAQRGHAPVHAAVVDYDFIAPYAIENLIAREGAAETARKEFQKPELFAGERNLAAIPEELVRGKVELAFAELKGGG